MTIQLKLNVNVQEMGTWLYLRPMGSIKDAISNPPETPILPCLANSTTNHCSLMTNSLQFSAQVDICLAPAFGRLLRKQRTGDDEASGSGSGSRKAAEQQDSKVTGEESVWLRLL